MIGGIDKHGKLLNSVEKYSIQENKWTLLNVKMPQCISNGVTFKVSNRKFLIFGGFYLENSFYVADPESKELKRRKISHSNPPLGVRYIASTFRQTQYT